MNNLKRITTLIQEILSNKTRTLPRLYSFKSDLCLENVYPQSKLLITTPVKKPDDKEFNGFIPMDKINITYSASSGPGGQNVNKVHTKVDVRFHVSTADWLSSEIREKLISQNKTKISKEGFLIMRSDKTSSQQLNLADALQKIRLLIWTAAEPSPEVSPETVEKFRRKKEKAIRERLMEKRERSQIKNDRQAPVIDF